MAHLWRGVVEEYRDRLPVGPHTPVVTLGEGGTPLTRARTLSARTACDVVSLNRPVDGLATRDAALRGAWCSKDELVSAEYDGMQAHMTARQLRDDRRRHNWLTENGWTLLHFTDDDVYRVAGRRAEP